MQALFDATLAQVRSEYDSQHSIADVTFSSLKLMEQTEQQLATAQAAQVTTLSFPSVFLGMDFRCSTRCVSAMESTSHATIDHRKMVISNRTLGLVKVCDSICCIINVIYTYIVYIYIYIYT